MRLNKHQIGLAILITAAVIFAAGNEYYRRHNQAKPFSEIGNLKYESLITPQDRAPLGISPSAKKKGRAVKIPILMYHHVGTAPANADAVSRGLTVSSADFETQVKWLKDSGFNSITLNDIYLYSLGKFSLPKKPVVFTFDDGYEDVFLNAIPILKKYGYTGSFAIITQFPGTTGGTNIYATWQEIAAAYQAGNEIVSHTQNHFDGKNAKFSADYILQNLQRSASDIQNHLGFAPDILIYPYGHYTPAYIEQARKAGFVMGITVHEGDWVNLEDLMEIPRIRIHSHEDFEMFKKLVS